MTERTRTAVDVVYEGEGGPWTVARVAQRGADTFVEYTDEHTDREVELAPLRHPIHDKARRFVGTSEEHLPGLLADAGPDSWGRSVLRREMRRHDIEEPTALDMLTWLGNRTMGALTFRPASGPDVTGVTFVDLDRMQGEALRHLADTGSEAESEDQNAEALAFAAGASPGGARPKIAAAFTPDGELVVDDGELPVGSTPWLVKFHGADDSEFLSAIEATYLQMAIHAGIATCEHRLLTSPSGTRFLAVRRFDRVAAPDAPPRRIHMATAAGLLEAYPEYGQHVSYDDIIRLTRRVTSDARDVAEVARRAVFNVVAHNRDDHARNVAYLWTPTDGWRLAPAYDLTFSMGPRPVHLAGAPGEHYLDVAGKGFGITRSDLLGLHKPAGLKPADIDEMVDASLAALGRWGELAGPNGVSIEAIDQVSLTVPALADG